MRTNPNSVRPGRAPVIASAEDDLEAGEPIPDEGEGQPKIAGMRGNFGGGPPPMPKPDKPGDGVIVLASAKYLQRDPEPELRREQERRAARERAEQNAASGGTEKSILTSGALGGVLAMLVAVVWFFVGLMNDYIYFYPPVLFVCGLGAVMKALMGGSEAS